MAQRFAYQKGSAAEAAYLKQLQDQANAEEQARFAAQAQEQAQRQGVLDSLKAADDQRQAQMDIEGRVQQEVAKRQQSNVQQVMDRLFGSAREAGRQNILGDSAEKRKKLIAEENALGRLQSPVSIPTLARQDDATAKALALFEGQLAGQQANQQTDIVKFIEDLLGRESQFARSFAQQGSQFDRTLGNQQQQFGQTLDFNKERAKIGDDQWLRSFTAGEEQRGINNSLGIQALQEQKIGNARATDARKPGFLNYLDTAFRGLGALGTIFPPAGVAGSLGQFGTNIAKTKTAGVDGVY